MADIFPPSLAFAGFCRKVKRTISVDHAECASKQLSEHTKFRSSKKRSLAPHSPSPSASSQYSSDTPSKSSAHSNSVSSSTRHPTTPRSPAIISSGRESPFLQESGDHTLDNGLTNSALIRESGRVASSSLLSSASRRRRSSAPSSSTISAVGTTTITTTTSTTSTKPILFINNIAPVVSRPKPSMTVYVQSQSALQQKVRKQLREQGKIKRSSNCFIKYRTFMHPLIVAKYGNQNNKEISKLAGRSWRNEPEHIKAIYRQQASEEKQRHESLFPSYVYTPARHNHNNDCSNHAPGCPSAKLPSPTSAASKRSGTHSNSQTSDSLVESGTSHESVKRSKTSRRTHGSGTSSRPASERPTFAEKPFVVTETPLHDFNGDSELAAQKRPLSKSRRQRDSNVDKLNKSGSIVSKESIATTTPTLRSDPPSFVEPSCHPISSSVVPVCAIDLPSAQSTAHEEVWMGLDLSQDFPPNMSERSEVWSSVFPSSLGYPLSLPGRMATPDQTPILSALPFSVPGHHHQSLPQHNDSTQSLHFLEQSFTFPQVQEFKETSLLTKPLLDNSFHQSFSWDLSAAVPGSLDSPTYDYSSTSVGASMPLFSNQNLPMTAATVTTSPQDFATPVDSTKGDFAHISWLADTSHSKEWLSSLYSFSSMAIVAPNFAPTTSSCPGSSSSLSPSPGGDYQLDTISTSMAPPPLPPTYVGLFDGIVSKNAPLNEWNVSGAASGLCGPMTGDLIATAAIANTTDNNHNNDSRQNDGLCCINNGSSNHSSNSNSSTNGPRSVIQQPFHGHRQQETLPAYVDGSVHGCSDDELQQSIEFYERVLEQQKFQLSMQRQIRLQTAQQQPLPLPLPPPPQQ